MQKNNIKILSLFFLTFAIVQQSLCSQAERELTKPSATTDASAEIRAAAAAAPTTPAAAAGDSVTPNDSDKKPKLTVNTKLGAAIARHYQPRDNSPSIGKTNGLLVALQKLKQSTAALNRLIEQEPTGDIKEHLEFSMRTALNAPYIAVFDSSINFRLNGTDMFKTFKSSTYDLKQYYSECLRAYPKLDNFRKNQTIVAEKSKKMQSDSELEKTELEVHGAFAAIYDDASKPAIDGFEAAIKELEVITMAQIFEQL